MDLHIYDTQNLHKIFYHTKMFVFPDSYSNCSFSSSLCAYIDWRVNRVTGIPSARWCSSITIWQLPKMWVDVNKIQVPAHHFSGTNTLQSNINCTFTCLSCKSFEYCPWRFELDIEAKQPNTKMKIVLEEQYLVAKKFTASPPKHWNSIRKNSLIPV